MAPPLGGTSHRFRKKVLSKASADDKAEHTRQYVSILNRQITPPSDVRRIFEMSSRNNLWMLVYNVNQIE